MSFNQKEYIKNYNKENYKIFKVYMKKEEKEELDNLLKKYNISNADFLKNAIINFKEERNMLKYVVLKEVEHFKRNERGGWDYECIVDNPIEKIFSTKKEALDFYNEVEVKEDIQKYSKYSDIKQLYEFKSEDLQDEDAIDYDLGKLLEERILSSELGIEDVSKKLAYRNVDYEYMEDFQCEELSPNYEDSLVLKDGSVYFHFNKERTHVYIAIFNSNEEEVDDGVIPEKYFSNNKAIIIKD